MKIKNTQLVKSLVVQTWTTDPVSHAGIYVLFDTA